MNRNVASGKHLLEFPEQKKKHHDAATKKISEVTIYMPIQEENHHVQERLL